MALVLTENLFHAIGRVLAVRRPLPDKHWELQDALDDLEAIIDKLPTETPTAPAGKPSHR